MRTAVWMVCACLQDDSGHGYGYVLYSHCASQLQILLIMLLCDTLIVAEEGDA